MRYLLLFIPLAIVSEFVLHNQLLLFVSAALALIALSALLGEAIEVLSSYTGAKIGALLNATLGNAAELIFTVIALRAGQITLVKASIVGAILGNLLVLPGLGMLLGGLKNGRQYFDRDAAGVNSTMMSLSVAGLILPTIFELLHEAQNKQGYKLNITDKSLDEYSLGIAGVLIVVYILSLIYSFTSKSAPQKILTIENKEPTEKDPDEKKQWSLSKSLLIMAGSTLFLIYMSDLLVGSVQHVIQNFHVSETFLGIILIPLLSDVAEHVVGVQMAYKNKMDLSMSISLESATQIALFVAPVLVFISFFLGKEMTLFFSPFEVVILGLSVYIINQISEDGESNWLEGAQLMVLYIIAAIGFYLL
jgi:Ca2+:H+ antiporter